jgi:hypothetical protein
LKIGRIRRREPGIYEMLIPGTTPWQNSLSSFVVVVVEDLHRTTSVQIDIRGEVEGREEG